MADSFVHLHVHTEYSMLDGAAKNGKLIAEVERQGMPAVAMSDHGNMFGAYEFQQIAKKTAVKPIIGIEAYVAPESRFHKKQVFWAPGGQRVASADGEGGKDVSGGGRYTHMTMWAENADGLRNLFRLSSLASMEGYYMKPRMDRELISQHAKGIIATTGCPSGEVQTRLRLGQYDEAVKAADAYQQIFGKENYFLELMDHGLDIERSVREDLLRLAKQLNIPLLATNDSHYVTEDQADAHDNLLCVGVGKNKDDPNRFKFNGSGYYIKTPEEMRELFRELPEACDNTLAIGERIQPYDEVFTYVDRMPQFDVPEGETQASWLRHKIAEGLPRRYGDNPSQEVLDRIELEMGVISPMGFDAYFLVVADICQYARDNGIPVGPGRGSAAGSIVAYLTRITELDPLEHDLLFERFLNPERINPPDVDIDFDDRQRDQMVRYVTEKYGEAYTAQVNTFGTIKAKAAVKDANRILGYPFSMGDRITKAMPPDVMGKGVPLYALFDESHPRYSEGGEIRAMYENEPDVRKIIDTGKGIEGLTRGTGVHAAAVILSSAPLLDLIPLHKRDKDGVIITGFSYPQCEEMGLIKMDFLGLRNLGIIDHAIKIIQANRGVEVDTEKIPIDDPTTYELLARGDTLGVFQLDGGPMRALLKLMKPTEFADISAVSALYRPGPMGMNSHTNYALRKNAMQEITPIHPELEEPLKEVLGPTYGLIVYQEQVQRAAQVLAGYSLGQADLLRRAMGKKKKEVLEKEFVPFHAGCQERGYSDEAIQAVWDVLVPFAGYAFNKSHSAAYGLVSYWTAFLKANYPAEYMAALLTSVSDDKDKMAVYLAECRRLGIKILSPDVNESVVDFTAVGDSVRFGLKAVRNVGIPVIESLVKTRSEKGKYTSFADFLDKVELVVCNKRTVDSLIKAGAFDSLGHTRQSLVAVCETAIDSVTSLKKQQAIGQDDLFGSMDTGVGDAPSIGLDFTLDEREWPRKHLLSLEREMLGLYVSSHPLDGAEHILSRNRDTSIADLLGSGRTEGYVKLCGLITSVDRRINKAGNPWAIITIADRDGSVEVLYFPKAYQLVAHELIEDNVISVRGRLNERDGAISIFGEEMQPVDISSAEHGGKPPIQLNIPERKINPRLVAELKRTMRAHPGDVPVRLLMSGHSRNVLFELGFLVDPESGFASDIKSLLGPGVWATTA
ncbi:DNA polymerase III subunit alpha [Streptacidiphilus sp. PB12-B1b]|uniref:DNA polymerase III subunit alpha n=1 Tax=Streptacidiphilus sp. PB12-B1b TaxID=2705012 RepID=UPI0015FB118D|nr:DNA polymerase III subunit alpha [Streptacidiphilus sp. PB12-B1b]QMU75926.1 DNA polymerase III subunit alpha [Streptacidiphilus sp. PB12-B1b]